MILWTRSRIANVSRAAAPPAVIVFAAAVLLRFPPTQYNFYPLCPIHELLHLQCPGCGATRAFAALLRGHFVEAVRFNALATLLLPVIAAYCILCYSRFLHRQIHRWPQPSRAVIYAGFAMAAVFTVIRNLPFHS